MIYIIGHKKPDLDSVASAIAFAQFQNKKHKSSAIPAITDPINNETEFILNKFNFTKPQLIKSSDIKKNDEIILVDHNEKDQRLDNLNPEQIIGIFDHHKINLDLPKPIRIEIRILGSTCTLLWLLFQRHNFSIKPKLASLMLCGILSDTVGFKSATTTDSDKIAGTHLSKLASISNIDKLIFEIFQAKSNINNLTEEQIIKNDYKIFKFGNKKVFIGQLETVEQEKILKTRSAKLLTALNNIRQNEKIDLMFLAITDILRINTKIITDRPIETQIIKKAFNKIAKNNITDIGPLLSRKKEIAPAIEKIIIS